MNIHSFSGMSVLQWPYGHQDIGSLGFKILVSVSLISKTHLRKNDPDTRLKKL